MTLTSWRAPGSANTHQTNYHRNDVYQAICLKLSMLVCIKLIANIRSFQRDRICTFDFIDKVHELFAFPSYMKKACVYLIILPSMIETLMVSGIGYNLCEGNSESLIYQTGMILKKYNHT